MNQGRVIIVGGGAAGVAAATRLVNNGFPNVTILEAEDRLGGRCNTVALGNEYVDLGAQWIHGANQNVVYSMAAPLNLTKDSIVGIANLSRSQFIRPNQELLNPDISSALYGFCMELLHHISEKGLPADRNLSLGEVFMKSFNENLTKLKDLNISDNEINQFLEWYQKFENSLESSDSWNDVSFEGYLKYKECEGNLNVAWKSGGYSNIIDLLVQKIPKTVPEIQLNVLFGKEVIQITRNHEVVVKCADESVFTADHVIVSVSLGVLKHNVESMFNPPLPSKKLLAINTLALGVAEKLFVQFPQRWWPEDCVSFNILLDSDVKEEFTRAGKEWLVEVFTFFALDNAPNTLCGWVGGNSARYISKLPDKTVMEDLHYLLTRYLSNLYTIPSPVRFTRSNWFGNPHFRGSYSFVTVEANATKSASEDIANPILDQFSKPVLMFAGEATHSHFFSTVHGAVETGWREADRLTLYYKNVRHVNTVIVGGGMAGIGAAVTLQKRNVDYILLEAQNYLGGRVHSIHEGQTVLDVGAQWLHGTENDLYKWAKKENLISNEVGHEGRGLYVRDDKTIIQPEIVDQVDSEVTSILKKLEDFSPFKVKNVPTELATSAKSVGQFLQLEFEKRLKELPKDIVRSSLELFHWHKRFQVIDNACDSLNDLPVEEWGSYSLNGAQDNIILNNGYSSLVKCISSALPPDRVRLNSVVKKIQWYSGSLSDHLRLSSFHIISGYVTDELLSKLNLKKRPVGSYKIPSQLHSAENLLYPVSILCEDGSQVLAQHVIVTCSLGFLKKNHEQLFSPPLPPVYRNMIRNIGFGAIDKIFLIYERCWWNPSVEGFQLIWSQLNSCFAEQELGSSWFRDLTGFDVLSMEPPILVGWVGGPGAKLMEDLPEEKLAKDCQNLLQKFLREPVPLPSKVVRSQWINNPYIAGGYSHATRKCWELGLRPVDLNKVIEFSVNSSSKHPVILFAGEANSEHHFSTAHGAYHSGIDRARIVLEHHNMISKL